MRLRFLLMVLLAVGWTRPTWRWTWPTQPPAARVFEPPDEPCNGAPVLDTWALEARFAADVHPLLVRPMAQGGCIDCHHSNGGLDLVLWPTPDRTLRALWAGGWLDGEGDRTLMAALSDSATLQMPLGGVPWSSAERREIDDFADLLCASGLEAPPVCAPLPDPGEALIRRLSNAEYDRTVADLTGDTVGHGQGFPGDATALGFDGVASAQTVSAPHVDAWLAAAQSIAADTVHLPEVFEESFEAEELSPFLYTGAPMVLGGHGGARSDHFHFQRIRAYVTSGLRTIAYPGTYTVTVRARGRNADYVDDGVVIDADVPPLLEIAVGDVVHASLDVPGAPGYEWGEWADYTVQVPMDAGPQSVRVWMGNARYGSVIQFDTQLDVDTFTWEGPLPAELPAVDTDRVGRFLLCDLTDTGCPETVVGHTLTTLWRRPATLEEITRYITLMDEAEAAGDAPEQGLRLVLQAALTSPNFLFRPELDVSPVAAPLSGYEMATRLSYFLWSTAPDAPLLSAASQGLLGTDSGLSYQVQRMLDDPRSSALVDNFATQWLELERMANLTFSEAFSEYDEALGAAMAAEVRLQVADLLTHNGDVRDLVDADHAFLNDRLAAHYGLPLPLSGESMTLVDVSGTERGGLLSSAGFFAVTSHPAKTSPTLRGKWLLDQLLCQPPAEPPPDVNTNVEPDPVTPTSLVELLALHADDPACAGCHSAMDPLGIAMEHYDPLGRWRAQDDFGQPIQIDTRLLDGTHLSSHAELVAWVRSSPAYTQCVTTKMLTYALGTDPGDLDVCAVDAVQTRFAEGGYALRSLIEAIVLSPLFRERRGELP